MAAETDACSDWGLSPHVTADSDWGLSGGQSNEMSTNKSTCQETKSTSSKTELTQTSIDVVDIGAQFFPCPSMIIDIEQLSDECLLAISCEDDSEHSNCEYYNFLMGLSANFSESYFDLNAA